MTTDEAIKIIAEIEDHVDYSQKRPIIRGLLILDKYDERLDYSFSFEHDQMWAADFEDTVKKMTVEEVTEMAHLGWFEDQDSWSHY
jgi:hypothetical protein